MPRSGFESGGQKARAFIRKAKAAQRKGNPVAVVGIFADGDGSALRAAVVNEFGTRNADGSVRVPERPFFRNALDQARRELPALIARKVDPATLTISRADAAEVAAALQRIIEGSIVRLRSPANAPDTLDRKRGDNPLVDDRVLVSSIRFEVTGG